MIEKAPTKGTRAERVFVEDLLKSLYQAQYDGRSADISSIAGMMVADQAVVLDVISRLIEKGLVRRDKDTYKLTDSGRAYALQIIRAHRLYETYLARETGVSPEVWHKEAHNAEHNLTPAEVDELADKLGHPRFDPHGDPIPTRDGVMPQVYGVLLPEWEQNKTGIILHIEDEPPAVYARMISEGLSPGMRVRIVDSSDLWLDIASEGKLIRLKIEEASLIRVGELPQGMVDESGLERLSALRQGEEAVVRGLMPSCTGLERKRLLDLGLVKGSKIKCEFSAPFGSPITYSVRGTLIALRREQAEKVLISRTGNSKCNESQQ